MAKKGQKFKKYSPEFKEEVAKSYLNGEGGYGFIANKYNLPDKSFVKRWVLNYKDNNNYFKEEKRGRSSKGRPKSVKLEEMSLEEQVKYLKMENDILKKVRALQKD